jgi:mannose-6-phosphate isomerase-like protein (cupin superfamily)
MGFDVSAEPFVIQADDLSGVPLGTAGRGRLRIYTQRPAESGFAVVDATHQPAEPRIRDHVHSRHDETFIILDGSYRIRLGDQLVTAQQGEVVFVPRGTAHTFRNVSSGPGRLLNIISPADGVELLRDLAELMPTKPTEEVVAEIHERYGAALVAPLPGQAI